MYQQTLEAIASQKQAEMQASAASNREYQIARGSAPQESLRIRTGWTLVHLGLRLVAQPGRSSAVAARPASS